MIRRSLYPYPSKETVNSSLRALSSPSQSLALLPQHVRHDWVAEGPSSIFFVVSPVLDVVGSDYVYLMAEDKVGGGFRGDTAACYATCIYTLTAVLPSHCYYRSAIIISYAFRIFYVANLVNTTSAFPPRIANTTDDKATPAPPASPPPTACALCMWIVANY